MAPENQLETEDGISEENDIKGKDSNDTVGDGDENTTYSGRFLEDNGLTLTEDENGRVTAVPTSSIQSKDTESKETIQKSDSELEDISSSSKKTEINRNTLIPKRIPKETVIELKKKDEKDITDEKSGSSDSSNQSFEVSKLMVKGDGFNVVLTHCTADFDSLASAVGLAKLWSSPHNATMSSSSSAEENHEGEKYHPSNSSSFDSYDTQALPTFVVLPRGAHPSVQKFLALHKHLFPIRSLKSLPSDLTKLNRVGLVDAQRRDRVGPAEHLLSYANRVTVVDHHIDMESDIPEATDYVVDKTGSVSTLIVESLQQAGVGVTEAEATLLALGIHADTGSLCYDSTTPRDAKALTWLMEKGASQSAIAEHSKSGLSQEQQGVLTQVLIHINQTVVQGVTVGSVLLSAEGFINGLAAVTQDAMEISGSDVLLLGGKYDIRNKIPLFIELIL